MSDVMDQENFFTFLALLWGQESMKNSTTPELRAENVTFMKSIGVYWLILVRISRSLSIEFSQDVRA